MVEADQVPAAAVPPALRLVQITFKGIRPKTGLEGVEDEAGHAPDILTGQSRPEIPLVPPVATWVAGRKIPADDLDDREGGREPLRE